MTQENLEQKTEEIVKKISFNEIAKWGVPSSCFGQVLKQYQERYGKQNVWEEGDSFCIKMKVNKEYKSGEQT